MAKQQKNQNNKNKPPKKLSPKEEADLKKKRAIFRELHDCFAQDEVFDAEIGLSELEGLITGMFQVWQDKIKVKDLELSKEVTEQKKYVLDVLSECTVSEAVTYTRALRTGIDQHKYQKLKGTKVKGLKIKLLD
jgi:hypothetical protein